jgi:3-hydroxybutyryl-CoA dehydrogenase
VPIKTVSVIGLGTLGTQIAIQVAYHGYTVHAYDQDPHAFERTIQSTQDMMRAQQAYPPMGVDNWEGAASKVGLAADLAEALTDGDLVIETLPENLDLKRQIWSRLDSLAPQEALLATNSSSIPVSRLEIVTQRPAKCLNMHFYMPALGQTVVDLMGGTQTTEEVLQTAKEFVWSVQCIPLMVKKETMGFCFNSIWRAIKRQSLYLWAEGFVDFRDIDRAWMVMFRQPVGPFFLMDKVGLDVVYDIEISYYNDSKDPKDHPPKALKDMIERGELGMKTGKGFYSYPNPEFSQPGFLSRGNQGLGESRKDQ